MGEKRGKMEIEKEKVTGVADRHKEEEKFGEDSVIRDGGKRRKKEEIRDEEIAKILKIC